MPNVVYNPNIIILIDSVNRLVISIHCFLVIIAVVVVVIALTVIGIGLVIIVIIAIPIRYWCIVVFCVHTADKAESDK